jgi:hypothetical protein
VDDQWKSWKHYFQKCSDVAVYNSEPHEIDYYDEVNPVPTAVDKTTVCTSFYKNIAFEIQIYVMTPQMSTIRKFHLLTVLKDFSEDYSGEVDSGGSDLSVSFSVVGEVDDRELEMRRNEAKQQLDLMSKTQKIKNLTIESPSSILTQPSPLIGNGGFQLNLR